MNTFTFTTRGLPRAMALASAVALIPAAPAQKPTGLRAAFARYEYGYQADLRKPWQAGVPVADSSGASLCKVQPAIGLGPWFGSGHSMWHRDNLVAMRRAGIDIALPIFRADAAGLAGYAENGLDTLGQALSELRRDKSDYPLIGMYLDTTSLREGGRPLDVGGEAGKARFYDAVRRFFRRIPPEFRAQAQTPSGIAHILAVGNANALANLSGDLRTYVDAKFRVDFARGLVWMGGPGWKAAAGNLDAYAAYREAGGLEVNTDGGIRVATLGPGFPRHDGLALVEGWRSLFAATEKPDWVVMESWNDYIAGNAVAPNRQYGVRETDGTMAGLLQFRNDVGPLAQAVYVNAPAIVAPRSLSVVDAIAQNGSLETWRPGDIVVSCSWFQDGKLVDEGPVVPLQSTTPMMGVVSLPVVMAAVNNDGTPLPAGDYEARILLRRVTVGDKGKAIETPFKEPVAVMRVTVGEPPADAARLVTQDLLPWMMAGSPTASRIIVRNDGSRAWPRGKTRLSMQLLRSGAGGEERLATGQSEPLTADVGPGDVTQVVRIPVEVPQGLAALPAGGDATYEVRWSVEVEGGTRIPVLEAPMVEARRVVSVLPAVSIAHFPLGNNSPPSWDAGKEEEVRCVVQNLGLSTWKASEVSVGYHWFYWDGVEAQWDSPRTPLPRDLRPGDEVMMRMKVAAPSSQGAYVMALDVFDGTRWLSTLPCSAGFDLSVSWVSVGGGAWRALELAGLFDVDGVASNLSPGDGDFAGGAAFAAENVPPDVEPPLPLPGLPMSPYPPGIAPLLYPAGYFASLDTTGTSSIRRVPFRYPEKRDGARNFLVARGQPLPVGRGAFSRLYLLGAGVKDTTADLKLQYADGTSEVVTLNVSAWDGPPKNGEAVGLRTASVRRASGDDASKGGWLFVYEVPADSSRTLEAIQFPVNYDFRVMAVSGQERGGGSAGGLAPVQP